MELEFSRILPNVGAAITLGLGMMALIQPRAASRFVSLDPKGKLGLAELRATYGGFFTALGMVVLVTQSPAGFTLLGAGWLGAAVGRTVSAVVDKSVSLKNFGGVLFEGAIAATLLIRG